MTICWLSLFFVINYMHTHWNGHETRTPPIWTGFGFWTPEAFSRQSWSKTCHSKLQYRWELMDLEWAPPGNGRKHIPPNRGIWENHRLKSSLLGGYHYVIWVFPKIVVPPNHPFSLGFSSINHPFWGTPIFGNTHIVPWRIKTSNSPRVSSFFAAAISWVHMKSPIQSDPTKTQDTNSWGFWSVHSKHLGEFSYITENPGNLKSFPINFTLVLVCVGGGLFLFVGFCHTMKVFEGAIIHRKTNRTKDCEAQTVEDHAAGKLQQSRDTDFASWRIVFLPHFKVEEFPLDFSDVFA